MFSDPGGLSVETQGVGGVAGVKWGNGTYVLSPLPGTRPARSGRRSLGGVPTCTSSSVSCRVCLPRTVQRIKSTSPM